MPNAPPVESPAAGKTPPPAPVPIQDAYERNDQSYEQYRGMSDAEIFRRRLQAVMASYALVSTGGTPALIFLDPLEAAFRGAEQAHRARALADQEAFEASVRRHRGVT